MRGRWFVVHEHVSVPVDLETQKPDLASKPSCYLRNGTISVEMMPSLMPTMPYSRASATRQMRPMSRL
jgi:hypothetical protein